jgi:hypothetical protein
LLHIFQAFINIIVKFSRDVVFSQLPDQFSQVALEAAAKKQILHNGECIFVIAIIDFWGEKLGNQCVLWIIKWHDLVNIKKWKVTGQEDINI